MARLKRTSTGTLVYDWRAPRLERILETRTGAWVRCPSCRKLYHQDAIVVGRCHRCAARVRPPHPPRSTQ